MSDRTNLPAPGRAWLRGGAWALSLALLVACGDKDGRDGRPGASTDGDNALPAPAGTPGRGVTGMPAAPGPGPVGPPDDAAIASAPAVDEFGNPIPPIALPDGAPADGSVPPLDGAPLEPVGDMPGEPTPQDAVAVVRDYYAAINAGGYGRAYSLWSDGGRASGQSPQQFADGFAGTAGVSVEVMQPGRVDAATGSRYIEVPVAISARQADGSERRYVGAYTLRRAVVDGATPEQRAWRITSADLREVQP